ncbi:hypothetical protein PV325_009955 [Microctonus aethiopoides]|nr:hypothetical protein PV325_009955 [Microctonus aethiopoides]KAK0094751.1 hypothetical protein PV326_010088 [Microctonus aethiopoides]
MASRILAIFPYPSYSHQVLHHSLTQALAEHGHELIVFTANPMNKNITNYHEVPLIFSNEEYKKIFNHFDMKRLDFWSFSPGLYRFGEIICDATLSHQKMQRLLSSKDSSEKIDLIIVSMLYWDSLYYLSDKLDAPLIGLTTFPDISIHGPMMGNPLYSSYVPNYLTPYSDEMNFFQRINNLYFNLRQQYEYYMVNLPIQERVLKKHFGNDVPPISQLFKRICMAFVNGHPYLTYLRPLLPNVIQIGGLRLTKMNKTLPTELKTILDKSIRGFIYFSLGSNFKSVNLGSNIINAFLQAFSELPYQIIWKFESDSIAKKPDNVYINTWLPQQGILAHPNIKLFIYQGGLQSSEEAIDSGVPLLGFPIFSDQFYNLNILIKRGVARALDINTIDKNQIKENIQEIIQNSSYRDNTIKLRKLLEDRPQHPMKQAIWWVEHVIRHKGTHHLHTRSQDLPWYTVELVDVFGFFVVLIVLLFLLGWTLWRLAIAMIKAQESGLLYGVTDVMVMAIFQWMVAKDDMNSTLYDAFVSKRVHTMVENFILLLHSHHT